MWQTPVIGVKNVIFFGSFQLIINTYIITESVLLVYLKSARAPPPKGGTRTRHERAAEIEPTSTSVRSPFGGCHATHPPKTSQNGCRGDYSLKH